MTARRGTPVILILLISTIGGASPGSASPEPRARERLLRDLSQAQLILEGDPAGEPTLTPARLALHRTLVEMVAGEDGFDLRTLGRLARAAIHTYTGEEPADPLVAAQEGGQQIHVGSRAGDLDGDGLADVLDYTLEAPGSPVILVARSGLTGTELWSRPLTGIDAIVQTLRAAAGDDLVLVEIHQADGSPGEDCLPFDTCMGVQGATYTWSLTILDGATGVAGATRSWDGALGAAYGYSFGDAYAFGQVVLATNAFLAVLPSDDHDGDGIQDIVIDEVDLLAVDGIAGSFAEAAGGFGFATTEVTATRASVVGGDDALPMFTRAAAGPGLSALFPGVDAVGGGTTDLVWDEATYPGALGGCAFGEAIPDGEQCLMIETGARRLEVIDGDTMVTAWTRDVSDAWLILPAGGDLDGDGAEDITLWVFGETLGTALVSGASGAELWRAPDILLGAVGDGLGLSVSIGFDDTHLLYDLNRRDGATGALSFSTHHEVELPTDAFDIFLLAEFSLIPDADGDADPDAYTQVTIYGTGVTVDSLVERGNVDEVIFQRHSDRERFALPVPDASGDGIADLLDVGIDFYRASTGFALAGIELPAGNVAWERTVTVHRDAEFYLDLNADTDGAGGSDYIMSIIQYPADAGLESALEVVNGATGGPVWTIGGPLTPAPPVPTGAIAGTLTGDGAPFFGACVSVATTEGEDVAFELAAPDGSYLVAELADGAYVVRYEDCFQGLYAQEWYDDAQTVEEATPVIVSGGTVTTGIDADLAAL